MSEASIKRKMSEGDQGKVIKEDVPCCSMHPESYLFQGIGLSLVCLSFVFGFDIQTLKFPPKKIYQNFLTLITQKSRGYFVLDILFVVF